MPTPQLVRLSDCRRALEHARLTSYEACSRASGEQLRVVGVRRDRIARFLAANRPDIIRALFGPVRWRADADLHGAKEVWLQVTLPIDAPDLERRLLAALMETLGQADAGLADARSAAPA